MSFCILSTAGNILSGDDKIVVLLEWRLGLVVRLFEEELLPFPTCRFAGSCIIVPDFESIPQ